MLAKNRWQLVGLSAYITSDKKTTEAILWVGAGFYTYNYLHNSPTTLDISAASVIRIGGATDSFTGQVSLVRFATPGGGNLISSINSSKILSLTPFLDNLCSPESKVEFGASPFALSCSGTNSLSVIDSKCYASCPTGSRPVTPFTDAPTPLCVPCSDNCVACEASGACSVCADGYKLTSDNQCAKITIIKEEEKPKKSEKSEKSGLSSKFSLRENFGNKIFLAGAIVGIAVGGVVIIAVTGWLIYALKIKKSLAIKKYLSYSSHFSDKFKSSRKVVAIDSPSSTVVFGKTPASPTNFEAKRLVV